MPGRNAAGALDKLRDDAAFTYRISRPAKASRRTVIALHGSGADETTMIPLAHAVLPDATIVAPRGRVDQDGELRWFRKLTPVSFDQESIRSEAAAFAFFLDQLTRDGVLEHPLDALYLGYSNGGNLVSSVMLLCPGYIRRAVLLRAMPVLRPAPMADLADAEVLLLGGARDATYGPFAQRLADLLRRRDADVSLRTIDADHMFGEADALAIRRWKGIW